MPSKSNFYSVIKGKTIDDVNNVFQKHNWTIRKSSFSGYEYRNSWAELVLENNYDDLLLHGIIAYHINNVQVIQELFNNFNCSYKFEFYDNNDLIIEQVQKDI